MPTSSEKPDPAGMNEPNFEERIKRGKFGVRYIYFKRLRPRGYVKWTFQNPTEAEIVKHRKQYLQPK